MDYIVIKGVPPYDGRLEFDMDGRPLEYPRVGLDQALVWLSPHVDVSEGWLEPTRS